MVAVESGNESLDLVIRHWLEWDRNETTSEEIQTLCRAKDYNELSKRLLRRLEFGTAGLRGRMGAGFSQMNDLVVIQTAQGLLAQVLKTFPDAASRGIVVGYDGRHHSKRFAELTAAVFTAGSVPVHLFTSVCPTPFVPFAVVQYKSVAGVMVTASHNPKEDNGYKVYWANGAQIIAPTDASIAHEILQNLQPLETSWNTPGIYGHPLVSDGLDEIMDLYLNKLPLRENMNELPVGTIVYTAMHGVGWRFVEGAFRAAQFPDLLPVIQQQDPDPEFPTVKFPNPEEGRSALDFSILTAEEAGSNLILANDPDADRLAVAEYDEGEWKVFTGNELGTLLGWWMLECYLEKFGSNADLSNVYMLSSTVSSKILKTMAKKHGFNFVETLTGFKWMGNIADQLVKTGKEVLFAFEEAIGFMCGTSVLDKDGVSAAVKVAELAGHLAANGSNLTKKLTNLYEIYGHHITLTSYWICHQPDVIRRIFKRLREFNAEHAYPKDLLNGKYKIVEIRDLTTGFDSSTPDKKAVLPISKSSEMITFSFDNGLIATLRTSGTEPKIKYYTELCADPKIQDTTQLNETLNEMINAIVEEFLQPNINGLIAREA